MDESAVRRRAWWIAITSPLVVLLVASGVLLVLGALLTGRFPGAMGFLGLGSVLAGAAAALAQWVTSRSRLLAEARETLQKEADQDHSAYLRQVERRFRRDPDTRPRLWLRQMRDLHERLKDAKSKNPWGPGDALTELVEKTGLLYRRCLASLERAADLTDAAGQMATAEAQQGLLDARRALLDEVEKSLARLATTLDYLQASALRQDRPEEELGGIRQELDSELETARRVEQRMADIVKRIPRANDAGPDAS